MAITLAPAGTRCPIWIDGQWIDSAEIRASSGPATDQPAPPDASVEQRDEYGST
jgi:hypothetical protein